MKLYLLYSTWEIPCSASTLSTLDMESKTDDNAASVVGAGGILEISS